MERPRNEAGMAAFRHSRPSPFCLGCPTVCATYRAVTGLRRAGPEGKGHAPQEEMDMSIEQFIDNEVKSNDVVLFMKGTPQFPQCGFSGQGVQILDHIGVPYKGINVLESADLRQATTR